MPAPLAIPAIVTDFPPIVTWRIAALGKASVVMIPATACQKPSGDRAAQAASTPVCSLSQGGSTPILPVEEGNTNCSSILKVRPTRVHVSRAKRTPACPGATLAISLFTTTARSQPVLIPSRPTSTGAAVDLLVVKAATAVAGTSETISPTSFFPLGLMPQATPAKRNPGTTIGRFSTFTRISSPHTFLLSSRHSGPLQTPWHFLYFLPLPQGQGSLRPTFGASRLIC